MSLVYGPWGSSNGDLYARGLGMALRAYRIYDPDSSLARDPEVFEKLRKDPVVSFALRYRKLLARGSDWFLEPASPSEEDRMVVQILEALLKEITYFDSARFNLAEAIVAGSRWAKIEGELKTLQIGEQEPMEWWVISALRDMDKRRFRQFPVEFKAVPNTVRTQTGPDSFAEQKVQDVHREWMWQIFRPLQQRWEEINREDYVQHIHENREEDLQYGSGLSSELYTYWYAKEVVLQQGLQYLERWAQGLLIAAVDTLRTEAGAGGASSPPAAQRMTDWLNSLGNMRSRHILVHDAKDKVMVQDAPPTGWKAALECIEYLDGALRVAILGASLPTSSKVEGGSYALAEVQERTTETLVKFDHAVVEDSVRRDILGWLYRKNKVTFERLGLGERTLPYFRLRSSYSDNHAEWADILIKAKQAGLLIRTDEAYARLGFSMPAEGDDVLSTYAEQNSVNQGGDPNDPEAGDEEQAPGNDQPPDENDARPGDSQTNSRDAAKLAESIKQSGPRNKIRPMNKPGSKKPDREKVIDKQTGGFGAHTGGFVARRLPWWRYSVRMPARNASVGPSH